MKGIELVILLALVEYFVFASLVGWARVKYKIAPPATSGDPIFERYFRVHQNTMEVLILFIPGLLLFARYVHVGVAVLLGALFIIARAGYAAAYVKEPSKRAYGSKATYLINAILIAGALVGLLASFA